jgi:predicted AAA+ superfamily ATPase
LGKEIATGLRGRTLPYEVLPLSFVEFLSFQHFEGNPVSSRGKAEVINLLREYLVQGGFPELFFIDKQFHQDIIAGYLELMMYKDLVER